MSGACEFFGMKIKKSIIFSSIPTSNNAISVTVATSVHLSIQTQVSIDPSSGTINSRQSDLSESMSPEQKNDELANNSVQSIGVIIVIATVVFWMGRNVFIHIPPGVMKFIKEIFSKEGLTAILKLTP